MRIILALCVIVGCTMAGRSLAGSARRRAAVLKQLAGGLKILRVHVVIMFEPIRDSLRRTECPLLAQIADGMEDGASAVDAWLAIKPRLRRSGGPMDALTSADERVLDRLFVQLGQSGRESQDILISDAQLSLESLYESAHAKVFEAERLYVTLGLLTGMMLALIVI